MASDPPPSKDPIYLKTSCAEDINVLGARRLLIARLKTDVNSLQNMVAAVHGMIKDCADGNTVGFDTNLSSFDEFRQRLNTSALRTCAANVSKLMRGGE